MALRTKTIGKNTFFEMVVSCPVCFDRGIHTEKSGWIHNQCNGVLFLGDNAHYLCDKCGRQDHVLKWKYGCPSHSDGKIQFVSSTPEGIAGVLCTAGMMVNDTGVAWLNSFMRHL